MGIKFRRVPIHGVVSVCEGYLSKNHISYILEILERGTPSLGMELPSLWSHSMIKYKPLTLSDSMNSTCLNLTFVRVLYAYRLIMQMGLPFCFIKQVWFGSFEAPKCTFHDHLIIIFCTKVVHGKTFQKPYPSKIAILSDGPNRLGHSMRTA